MHSRFKDCDSWSYWMEWRNMSHPYKSIHCFNYRIWFLGTLLCKRIYECHFWYMLLGKNLKYCILSSNLFFVYYFCNFSNLDRGMPSTRKCKEIKTHGRVAHERYICSASITNKYNNKKLSDSCLFFALEQLRGSPFLSSVVSPLSRTLTLVEQ